MLKVRAGLLENARPVRGRRLLLCLLIATFVGAAVAPRGSAQGASALNRVHTIQVGSMGDGESARALRQRLIDRLKKSGQIKVVENASAADVTLRGESSIWATGTISFSLHSKSASETAYQGYFSAELVGKENQVLWSYLVTPSRFHTASIVDDLADQMAGRLLDVLRGVTAGSGASATTSGHAQVALHAAGSTLAAPLYMKWFETSGMPVTYDADGSEAGIEDLSAGKVDFAGSDMPLVGGNTPSGLHVMQVPTVLGGVVPIYNLPSLGRTLRLTPQVLAGVYSGAIRKWNDPRIAELNRGASLPDAEITAVHRSDGSGTTYVWTSFLSLASPEWKASVGSGARVSWPAGESAAGNGGVAELVQKTPNSIGYVELIYAIQHELNYAAVRNPAGEFVKASLAGITAAAAEDATKGREDTPSILEAKGKSAYPISTFTWILVPMQGLSAEKKSAIADLLEWALTSGQKECAELGYAPLPREVVARELAAVKAWKGRE